MYMKKLGGVERAATASIWVCADVCADI